MLERVARHAQAYLDSLREIARSVCRSDPETLRAALGDAAARRRCAPEQVIDELVAGVDPGLVASAGPRYFGFVTGGALPAALAADWMAGAWDQNGSPTSPRRPRPWSRRSSRAGCWTCSACRPTASVGLVTGAQMANATCLAAARNTVLEQAGWDVVRDGLIGAPPITIVAGAEAHATIFTALRFIGLGMGTARAGRRSTARARSTPRAARSTAPRSCARRPATSTPARSTRWSRSPTPASAPARGCTSTARSGCGRPRARPSAAWCAASSAPTRGPPTRHKWLNVPYDSGLAIVADRAAPPARDGRLAAYLIDSDHRDNYEYTPEASRRARGFAIYAALRQLGRRGLADLVDRSCEHAAHFARLCATAAPRSSTRSTSTRCWSRASRTRSRACRPTARAGPAAPSGAAARRCGSACPAGRPRPPTSSARRRRSSPRYDGRTSSTACMVTGWREQKSVYRPGTLNRVVHVPRVRVDVNTSRGPDASLTLWASAPMKRHVTHRPSRNGEAPGAESNVADLDFRGLRPTA